MKLSVVQENFNRALSATARIIPSRASLPVLQNILLKTESSRLLVAATNLEMAIQCRIGAKIETNGSITVPGKMLTELVGSLTQDKIQLLTSDTNLRIKSTNLDARLNGIKADDFPVIPVIKPKTKLTIPVDQLIPALASVVVAAAIDEVRPVLNGVLFNIKPESLTLAATDSYRLAEATIPYQTKSSDNISVIVPVRAIQELLRLVSDDKKDILIELAENEAVFTIGDIQLITRLIDGNYPDYTQIFPQNSTTTITLEKETLQNSVKIASLFTRESANTIKLNITKNNFHITSSASEVGQNDSLVEAKIQGDPLTIQLNARYLSDALNSISTSRINLELTTDINPCIVRPTTQSKQSKITHIIMPLRS